MKNKTMKTNQATPNATLTSEAHQRALSFVREELVKLALTCQATAEADVKKGQHVAAARSFLHYADLCAIVTFIEEAIKE